MENRTEGQFTPSPQATSKSHKKGIVALVIAVMVLLAAGLGVGTLYYFEMTRANTLQRQVEELEVAAADMDELMAQEDHEAHMATAVQYREIPELGVKYKVTEETKDLTYVYTNDVTNSAKRLHFTTTALASLKDRSGEFPCVAHMPSGTITQRGEESISNPMNDPRMIAKQVGDSHYVYGAPEVGCMVDNQDAPAFQDSVKAVKAAFDSLEAM